MMTKRLFIGILLIFLSSGCEMRLGSPYTEQPSFSTTATDLHPTTTPKIEIGKTSEPSYSAIVKNCSDVYPYNPQTFTLPGKLILYAGYKDNYMIDLRSEKKIPFSPDSEALTSEFSVSHDGKWLAFSETIGVDHGTQKLVVESADRKERLTFPMDYQEWQSIAYWITNDMLVLWDHASPLDHVILFNPFTGKKQKMDNNLPDILPEDLYGWDFSWPSITIFSPSLDQVVYLKSSPSGYKLGEATLALWNIKKQETVAEIAGFGFTQEHPWWNLQGNKLIYVKSIPGIAPPIEQDEIFLLSSDGNNQQLTRLKDYYEFASIESYQWSPNEEYVAFQVVAKSPEEPQGKSRLLILNMSNLQVTDLCFSPKQRAPIVWSPDGQYLSFVEQSLNEGTETLVVDIQNKVAYLIDQDHTPGGWVVDEK
jgi:hypothetical protein